MRDDNKELTQSLEASMKEATYWENQVNLKDKEFREKVRKQRIIYSGSLVVANLETGTLCLTAVYFDIIDLIRAFLKPKCDL